MPRRASRRPVGRRQAAALSSFRARGMRSRAASDRETRVRITGWVAPKFSSLERNLDLAEYKNPQQEPGGDRRMLMVFAVTFALIIISQIFLFKDKGKQQPKPKSGRNLADQRRRAVPSRSPRSQARPLRLSSKGRGSWHGQAGREFRSHEVCQQRSRNRRRERAVPHRVYQPWRAGEVVGAEEIQRRRRTSARPGEPAGREVRTSAQPLHL